MSKIERYLIGVVAILILVFVVIAVRAMAPYKVVLDPSTQSVSTVTVTSTSAPSIVQAAIFKIIAPPSLSDTLRKRAVGCTEEGRTAFLKDAIAINDEFQDDFRLAVSASRIALAPIISQLQKDLRKIKELKPDNCGKMVQDKMIAAYDMGVNALLDFMAQRTDTDDVDTMGFMMQLQMREFGAYQADLVGPFIAQDISKVTDLKDKKDQAIPVEMQYMSLYIDHQLNCKDTEFIEIVMTSLRKATQENFSDLGFSNLLKDSNTSTTPTPVGCIN